MQNPWLPDATAIRERSENEPPWLSRIVVKWHACDLSSKAAILIEPDVPKTHGILVPDPKLPFARELTWVTSSRS
jgi:hypothetical protein